MRGFFVALPTALWQKENRPLHDVTEPKETDKFFPSGAILFFVLLLLFYTALWLVIYVLMIARS
jgi:hypothetical protein